MENLIQTTNLLFALGTVVFQLLSLILIIGLISKDRGPFFTWFAKNSLLLVFLVSLAAVAGSLWYQYAIGFEPCMWCWYQRVVMYPVAIISFVSLVKKKSQEVFNYSMVLAIIGVIFSVWHNLEKILDKEILPCSANGPSCLQNLVQEFGYIDIPVMSLTFFVLIVLIIWNKKRFAN